MDANTLKIAIHPMTVTELATHLVNPQTGKPITPQAVHQWRRIPVEHVLTIERVAGIPRHQLRPDVYPVDEAETSAA